LARARSPPDRAARRPPFSRAPGSPAPLERWRPRVDYGFSELGPTGARMASADSKVTDRADRSRRARLAAPDSCFALQRRAQSRPAIARPQRDMANCL